MPIKYSVIEIFSNEESRCKGEPLPKAVLEYVRGQKITARCIVTRGIKGSYENGKVATQNILELSFNMPLKIEIILPSAKLDLVLPILEEMVCEGIVTVREIEIRSYKMHKRLLP
jgi:PII-like signaling protein